MSRNCNVPRAFSSPRSNRTALHLNQFVHQAGRTDRVWMDAHTATERARAGRMVRLYPTHWEVCECVVAGFSLD